MTTINWTRSARLGAWLLILLLIAPAAAWSAGAVPQPAPDPPHDVRPEPAWPGPAPTPANGQTEWVYHKSADGAHPDGTEQQLVWLMNRARSNPTAEGQWLATSTESDVANGRDYFGVNTALMEQEFAAIPAMPPAAFDRRLYEAAYQHSLNLIARDAQDHDGQFDLVNSSGFVYTAARGNVFSYADNGLNCHAAWNIDWGGNDGTGMQTGRGHRMAVMSADGDYTNVGLASAPETNSATAVGPEVVTGNYCRASTSAADHYNVFIVGTVWTDANGNGRYDPGEGVVGATVRPDGGSFYAVTSAGGGYAIPVTGAGGSTIDGSGADLGPAALYTVVFSGGGLSAGYTKTVTVNGRSALLDVETTTDIGDDDGDPGEPPTGGAAELVTRFYQECLSREPDTAGLTDWVNQLESGQKTGADVAAAFIGSVEFQNRNTTDEEFVDILYSAFFGRAADEAGRQGWLDKLASGVSRDEAVYGFTHSTEFVNLCAQYGIVAY